MTTFKLGFLLAVSLLRKENLARNRKDGKKGKKNAKSKGSKKGSSKSSKSSKKGSSKASKRKMKEPVELPPYVLDVGNPIGYVHIEYELTWEKSQKQQIDIICWNGAVKVFLGNEDELSYRVRSTEETLWIPVFVRHVLSPMPVEDLLKFYKQEIIFHIFTSKKKVGAKAKSDKTKLFFLREEDTLLQDLTVPIFVANPNLEERVVMPSITKYMENIIVDCVYTPFNPKEMVNRLCLSDPVQAVRMNRIIGKVSIDENMFCKYFVPVPPPPDQYVGEAEQPVKKKRRAADKEGKKNKKKKEKKSKSSKTSSKKSQRKAREAPRKSDHLQMKVSGEVFFTDPTLSMYDFKDTNDFVTKAYVLLGVERLMTMRQKFHLNPMIIKIEKIENLNAQLLKEKGFKSIFVRYNVPFIAQAKTSEQDIAEKIRYNEAHAHFTSDVSALKFTQFIQSSRLRMEICGVREVDLENEVHPSIFGSQLDDKYVGRKMTPERYILHMQSKIRNQLTQTEVLAVACYDLTSLLTPLWNYTSKESCHNPDSFLYRIQTPFSSTLDPVLTTNTINLKCLFTQKSNSPLTDANLIDSGTVLKVEVYFLAPANSITNLVYFRNNCYNRLLLIIHSVGIATTLLNEILRYNQQQTGAKEAVVPDFNKMDERFIVDNVDYLTGFVIDNGASIAFFLEGIVLHQIGYIWRKYKFSSPDDVTVYFNTDLVFEDRIYGAFLPLRGIYVITLQKPLREILNNEMFYIQGNVPLPCWEAVKKLDILFRNTTVKDIFQQNLLPTPEELLSLNLEWGIPMKWTDSPSDNVSVSLWKVPM